MIWLVPMPTIKAQCLAEDGVLCAEGHLMTDPGRKPQPSGTSPRREQTGVGRGVLYGSRGWTRVRAGCLRRKGRGQGESEKTFMLRTRGGVALTKETIVFGIICESKWR